MLPQQTYDSPPTPAPGIDEDPQPQHMGNMPKYLLGNDPG